MLHGGFQWPVASEHTTQAGNVFQLAECLDQYKGILAVDELPHESDRDVVIPKTVRLSELLSRVHRLVMINSYAVLDDTRMLQWCCRLEYLLCAL